MVIYCPVRNEIEINFEININTKICPPSELPRTKMNRIFGKTCFSTQNDCNQINKMLYFTHPNWFCRTGYPPALNPVAAAAANGNPFFFFSTVPTYLWIEKKEENIVVSIFTVFHVGIQFGSNYFKWVNKNWWKQQNCVHRIKCLRSLPFITFIVHAIHVLSTQPFLCIWNTIFIKYGCIDRATRLDCRPDFSNDGRESLL